MAPTPSPGDRPLRHDRPRAMEGCGNHTGELVLPPHLPAGVDETDTANVVHLLMLLTMHARHEVGEGLGLLAVPLNPPSRFGRGWCVVLSRAFLPQHHEFGSRHREVVLVGWLLDD